MSLTRKEWEEMWRRVKRMEYAAQNLPPHVGSKKLLKVNIRWIQHKIQVVIGQME